MRVRFWIVSLTVFLGCCPGDNLRAAQPDQWVTFRHDYQRTGRTRIVGPQTLDTLKWKKPVASDTPPYGRVIGSSPVVGNDGSVYASSLGFNGNTVFTYLAGFTPSGELTWRQSLGQGQTDSSPSLAYGDDTLYIGAPQGVKSFAKNGLARWSSFAPDTTVLATPALSPDGRTVYAGARPLDDTPGNLFYALDAVNLGKTVWTTEQYFGPIHTSAAVGPDGTLYFGTQDGFLVAADPESGEVKWIFDTEGRAIEAAPSLGDDNVLYFGTRGTFDDTIGVIYAVDAETGLEKWSFSDTEGEFLSSAAIGFDGSIYEGNDDGYLYALTNDGHLKWRFDTGSDLGDERSPIYSSPAVGGDGTIYFGCTNGVLYALSPSGQKKAKYVMENREEIESSPSIGPDGTLYVGAYDGFLYAFKAGDPLLGDLNQSGKVDIGDAQLALKLVVSPSQVTPALLAVGDVYPRPTGSTPRGDKKISITDVILILRYVVGLETAL